MRVGGDAGGGASASAYSMRQPASGHCQSSLSAAQAARADEFRRSGLVARTDGGRCVGVRGDPRQIRVPGERRDIAGDHVAHGGLTQQLRGGEALLERVIEVEHDHVCHGVQPPRLPVRHRYGDAGAHWESGRRLGVCGAGAALVHSLGKLHRLRNRRGEEGESNYAAEHHRLGNRTRTLWLGHPLVWVNYFSESKRYIPR